MIVVASGTALAPTLQILDPDTGVPVNGTAIVIGGANVRVRGTNFVVGQVDLFVDDASGSTLGVTHANGGGAFTVDVTWPTGVSGPHAVYAQQGSRNATVQVYAQSPAQ